MADKALPKSKQPSKTATSNNRGNNGGGRTPLINEIDLEKFTALASQDLPNYEIAEALNISITSFYRLMRNESAFKEAYEKGIENRKYELEKALFKRAQGFTATETKIDTDEEGNVIKKSVTEKNYVPDAVSLIFALKNRYGEKYKDKIETTTNINLNIKHIEALSNEELLKLTENNEIAIGTEDYSIE